MEVSSTVQVFLRVLYTVNNSPQYILAKSSSQVPAIICSEGTMQPAGYARASLKACLTAVCDSSPELLSDAERDFSLYVLDPLEAQPPPSSLTSTPQNSASPRGVAVALGLMSWALESNDSGSVHVTGTLIAGSTPALEVVFALRETKRVHRPMVHGFHPWGQASASTSAPGLSQPSMLSQYPHLTGHSCSSTPASQPDQQEPRTLTRSADFPELYIGPPRRSRGRPEGSTSSKSKGKGKAQAGDSSAPGTSSSNGVDSRPDAKQDVAVKSKQRPRPRPPRPPPTNSPFISAPLTRPVPTGYPPSSVSSAFPSYYRHSYPSTQQPVQSQSQVYTQYSQPPYNPLLGLLSAISSASAGNGTWYNAPEQQAALLSALQGVLATNPQLLHLAANTNSSTDGAIQTSISIPKREDADDDIVILDSSTIDTTAFRKPGARPLTVDDRDTNRNTSSSTSQQESPMPPSSQCTEASPMPASTPPSAHESTPASSEISTPSVAPDSTPTPSSEADPNLETPTKRTSSGRTERVTDSISPSLSIPTTPTPSHTRKRKLAEYAQGQSPHPSSTSPFTVPDSPSPTVARTSSSTRGLVSAMRQRRVQSSPSRNRMISSPSTRLPSMLDSMRASASRLQASSSGSSTQTLLSSTSNRNARQSTESTLGSTLKPTAGHSAVVATSSTSAVLEDGTAVKRRRTLTEVMEDQERERDKARKRSCLKLIPDARAVLSSTQETQLRPVKSAPVPKHAQSSPPRPLFRSDSATSASQPRLPTSKPTAAQYPVVFNPAFAPPSTSTTMSTPTAASSTSTAPPTKNPFKNFVVPAWARTGTSTLPRLSEEALARQKAEREAKKAQVSQRRRDAAKGKRKRLSDAPSGAGPSKESSEDEGDVAANPATRAPRPSSSTGILRTAMALPPSLPSALPVFASDAVEPIPSSPPPLQRSLPPTAPSTPPRKRLSLGSGSGSKTPGQPGSGSGSLFTPAGSLFTPSTPRVSRSLSRITYTPRSPSVNHRSATSKSPLKSLVQTPRTPKRERTKRQTPRSGHSSRKTLFASPGSIVRTPSTGTRSFLLPPPSPCSVRTPPQKGESSVLGSSSSARGKATSPEPKSPPDVRKAGHDMDSLEDALGRELDEALLGLDVPNQPTHPATTEDGHEPRDATLNDEVDPLEDGYPSSPLPPSSPPPPTSPFSSPVKQQDTSFDIPAINDLGAPQSDIPILTASDTDKAEGPSDTALLSDDAATAAWITDSEANAWLSETEAWLTDTEGGPLLTDSDAAWLSDSDAVFGDMSSLPPSTASNWLSDDADVDTDGDVDGRTLGGAAFDAAAFEEAFAAISRMEFTKRSVSANKNAGENATQGETKQGQSEFWEAIQPFLDNSDSNKAADASSSIANEQDKVAQELQTLLNGLGAGAGA